MKNSNKYYIIGQNKIENSKIEGQTPVLLLADKGYHKDSVLHNHDYLELFYFLEGSGILTTKNTTVSFKKGQVMIINAKVDHSIVNDKEDKIIYYSMSLTNINLKGLPQNCISKDEYVIFDGKDAQTVLEYIENIVSEFKLKKPGYMLFTKGVLYQMFAHVCRLSDSQLSVDLTANEIAQKTKKYIEDNYISNLTLEDLTSALYANKFHIIHSFKKAYNLSPLHYLATLKMNKAKELLSNSKLTISEIANAVGYENPVYFAEHFKKIVGTTPSSFRKITNS